MSLAQVLQKYSRGQRESLLPLLQEIQQEEGFLSEKAIGAVSRHLGIPGSQVYGVATFYDQFVFSPPASLQVSVCRGTACHLSGSESLLETLGRQLGVEAGMPTRDGVYSLSGCSCQGACGKGPVVVFNGIAKGGMTAGQVKEQLQTYLQQQE